MNETYLLSIYHIGLNGVPPALIHVHPESGNVILFGERVFADEGILDEGGPGTQ